MGRCEALCAQFPTRVMSDTAAPVERRMGGDLGNCSCKREKGGWVALHPPPVSHRPATPVVQGVADFEGLQSLGGLLALPALKLWVAVPVLTGVLGL